jgi:hypothetical protein
MEDSQQLEKLLKLPVEERLRLARWLIESASVASEPAAPSDPASVTPLLALAARYWGDAATAHRTLPISADVHLRSRDKIGGEQSHDNHHR